MQPAGNNNNRDFGTVIPLSGQFTLQDTAGLTEQPDPASTPAGYVHRGAVVQVLEGRSGGRGSGTLLKLSGFGWASLAAADGTELFVKNTHQANGLPPTAISPKALPEEGEEEEEGGTNGASSPSHGGKAAEKDAAAAELSKGVGIDFFRARQKVLVRADASGKKGRKAGTLLAGTLVEGLELSRSTTGRQMRCHQGWVPLGPAYFDRIARKKLKFLTFEFDPTGLRAVQTLGGSPVCCCTPPFPASAGFNWTGGGGLSALTQREGTAFCLCFRCLSCQRHCLLLVISLPFLSKALSFACASAAFLVQGCQYH